MTDQIDPTLDQSKWLRLNAEKFGSMVHLAADLQQRGQYLSAAVLGEICALYGAYSHNGSLLSEDLEQTLQLIGRATISVPASETPRARVVPSRVLHVLTAAKHVGGDTRFVWRWIERDAARQHSVALTRQSTFEIPPTLRDGVERRGGQVFVLDHGKENVIERARALRKLASNYDAVFLHVYIEDIVPTIALFEGNDLPPTIFVMQADHQFFVGLTVSDSVVHMRESGVQLSLRRRNVDARRLAFLPIPLEPLTRSRSQSEARRLLGLPDDAVVLLSVARSVKYTPVGSFSFIESAVSILERHPSAIVIVVGAENTAQWQKGSSRVQGRLRAVGPQNDTSRFYESADIYLDSYPFASNTSLLEAGSLGLPLVSYFPFSEKSDVLAAGTPGLEGVLMKTRNIDEYLATIAALVNEPDRRLRIGIETREQIRKHHSGDCWREHLEEMMMLISRLPGRPTPSRQMAMQHEDLDHLLSLLYRQEAPLGTAISRFARQLPYSARTRLLLALLRIDRSFSFELFLPHSVARIVGPWFRGWRNLPGARLLLRPKVNLQN